MCGHFANAQTREDYFTYHACQGERDIVYDPDPI